MGEATKQEMLQELLNEKTIDEAKERITKRYERQLRSIKEFSLATCRKHSSPASPTFSIRTRRSSPRIHSRILASICLSLVGIGALLSEEDGYCVIKELIPGGPAKNTTDLKPNDRIVAVAQGEDEPVDIVDMGLRKVVDKSAAKKAVLSNSRSFLPTL